MMKMNEKYLWVIFTAFAVQLSFGIKLGYTMPCEEHLKDSWDQTTATIDPRGKKVKEFYIDSMTGYFPVETFDDYKKIVHQIPIKYAKFWLEYNDSGKAMSDNQHVELCVDQAKRKKGATGYTKFDYCAVEHLIANRCNTSAFLNGVSGQQSSSSNSSNQSSNSGSANQPSSGTAQSNSPESYNLQVSKTNKQNYQTMQQAYNQAMQGKGKKHNKEANSTECMKTNPAQKSFTNKCNQPINFTYCFSGVPQGAKNENPQTLSELSCQNGQFATMTIGAGESIPGAYNGLTIEGLPCKSPSQPVDMSFDRATNAATGRCSF